MAAIDHLAGGAPGERQQQHPLGGRAIRDDPRDPGGERSGLASARAGENPQCCWFVELRDCSLLVVEAIQEIVCVHAFDSTR